MFTGDSSNENDVFCLSTGCFNGSWMFNETYYNGSWPEYGFECFMDPLPNDFSASNLFHACVYLMYGTIFVVALFGNGLVCLVVYKSPRMKTVTNYFIVNLAIGDMLMTVFCVPFSFVSMLILKYWPFGGMMCKVVNFSQAVSVLVSAYTLLAISIDRYMAIIQPLKPRLEKTVAKIVVAGVWCGAVFTATPIAIVSQLHKPSMWHEVCKLDICMEQWANWQQSQQYTCALLALQFLMPLAVLVYTYARIAHVVWRVRPPGEAQTVRDMRMQSSKRKMVKMMVTVVAVFTVCWLPLNIFIILWTIHADDESWGLWAGTRYVWFVSHWLAMSQCCYNPIIYCYMNERYRREFKKVLKSFWCTKVEEAPRSCHRSSICQGIPLSEMVNVNGSMQSRRDKIRHKGNLPSEETRGKCSKCPGMQPTAIMSTRSTHPGH